MVNKGTTSPSETIFPSATRVPATFSDKTRRILSDTRVLLFANVLSRFMALIVFHVDAEAANVAKGSPSHSFRPVCCSEDGVIDMVSGPVCKTSDSALTLVAEEGEQICSMSLTRFPTSSLGVVDHRASPRSLPKCLKSANACPPGISSISRSRGSST